MSTDEEKVQALKSCREYFEKLGMPTLLHASVLLGIIRDDKPIGSIFELAFMAEDLTEEILRKWKEDGWYGGCESGKAGFTNLYFDYEGGPRIEMGAIYIKGEHAFTNITDDKCLYWPKHVYGEKENWRKIVWDKVTWNAPAQPHKWLRDYYGDWEEHHDFNWHSAKNLITWDDLQKKINETL